MSCLRVFSERFGGKCGRTSTQLKDKLLLTGEKKKTRLISEERSHPKGVYLLWTSRTGAKFINIQQLRRNTRLQHLFIIMTLWSPSHQIPSIKAEALKKKKTVKGEASSISWSRLVPQLETNFQKSTSTALGDALKIKKRRRIQVDSSWSTEIFTGKPLNNPPTARLLHTSSSSWTSSFQIKSPWHNWIWTHHMSASRTFLLISQNSRSHQNVIIINTPKCACFVAQTGF